jgi:hypothetical protein
MDKKITLVGKVVIDESEKLDEGYTHVEFEIESLLDEIGSYDVRTYAKRHFDLIPIDELDDTDTDDLVSELQDRDYNFIRGAEPEALIAKLEVIGYKVFDEYDKTYDEFLKLSALDNIDLHKLKEIVRKFMQGSLQEREDMYQTLFR